MCVSPIFKNTTNLEIRVKEKLFRECPRLILSVEADMFIGGTWA